MKKFLVITFFTIATSVAFVLVNSTLTSAQCGPLYGGGITCPSVNISINKMVAHPQSGTFVDNLGINDTKFVGEQTVTFQLVVTNTGNSPIARVVVKDVFPQFVSFISGPGTFDANTKALTFELTSLAVGESRTFTLTGKVIPEIQLPQDVGVSCVTNQVIATTNEGQSASDVAQLCIERKVLGAVPPGVVVVPPSKITQIPPTGVNLFMLVGFASTGLLGFYLRKKSLS